MQDEQTKTYGVTLTFVSQGSDTDDDGWQHYAYDVTLTKDDVSITVPWRQGLAITEDPTVENVLECLISDAQGANGLNFEEWADEYGYDPDSRKAEKIYNQIVAQGFDLRNLLAEDYEDAILA